MKKIFWVKGFSLLLIFQCYTTSSFSCDCPAIIGMKDAITVFNGEVLSIKRKKMPYIYYEIKFRVNKYIKGKPDCKKKLTISVPSLNAGGCGVPFGLKKHYQVYTYLEDGMLYTSACTETHEIKEKSK